MHRRVASRRLAGREKNRSYLAPAVIGLGIWLGFPTVAAYQDMTSMVSGLEGQKARWGAYVEKSVAGAVHAAEMPFADGIVTGPISGSGVNVAGVGAVSFRGKAMASDVPDEDRVTRADKRGRIVEVAPVAPPRNFTAGSVFERTSSLMRPSLDSSLKLAFKKPPIKGKEIQIAAAFHPKETRKPATAGMPPMLAALVNNDKPDILATAYAPAEPDYATTSPFESLLRDDAAAGGRFIPPMGKGDHSWIKNPLPASVFSKAEQTCLANAVYFEARGENVKGQAAVAQVVLNRVRNPAYPETICKVVYQNQDLRNRCQFSFACDGIKDRVTDRASYRTAEQVAMAVTAGKIFIPEVGSATHYYANYVSPDWARSMKKMTRIGLHIFYRTFGGGWS
ncbi:cell wall hydrolase [Aminobacter sp. BE322]|uniref:cell wall hydrolase n=1 Tax=unclassified Aminobacter TaxID=2644704 RepID=UPI003D215A0F